MNACFLADFTQSATGFRKIFDKFYAKMQALIEAFKHLVWNETCPQALARHRYHQEDTMFKAGLLWMMGVPFFVVVLLWMFFF